MTAEQSLNLTVERRTGGWYVVLGCPSGCECGVRTATGPFMSERAAERSRDVMLDGWIREIPAESIKFPPHRARVTGDLFHGRVPDGAVYVGRQAPGLAKSKFANPFKGESAAAAYRAHLLGSPELLAAARVELAGRDLACWCPPGQACHADVLIELANEEPAA